jgi:hypothetical protein
VQSDQRRGASETGTVPTARVHHKGPFPVAHWHGPAARAIMMRLRGQTPSGVATAADSPAVPASRAWHGGLKPAWHLRMSWVTGPSCALGPAGRVAFRYLINFKLRVMPQRGVACRPCMPQCAAQPRARFRLPYQKRGHGARAPAAARVRVIGVTVVSKEAQEPKESGRIGRQSPLSPPKGPFFVACERPGFRSSGAT